MLLKTLTGIAVGDVGGQRTLRPYWRNYFEQTDAIVWVVDSSDRVRIQDCKAELHNLLQEDVSSPQANCGIFTWIRYCRQRLTGASLLVFANKQDIYGSMTDKEIRNVRIFYGRQEQLTQTHCASFVVA